MEKGLSLKPCGFRQRCSISKIDTPGS